MWKGHGNISFQNVIHHNMMEKTSNYYWILIQICKVCVINTLVSIPIMSAAFQLLQFMHHELHMWPQKNRTSIRCAQGQQVIKFITVIIPTADSIDIREYVSNFKIVHRHAKSYFLSCCWVGSTLACPSNSPWAYPNSEKTMNICKLWNLAFYP